MDHHPTKPVNPAPELDEFEGQDLDHLLSLRGKPFSNWKEERLYLREKWGMQGRQVEPGESPQSSKDKDQ